MALTPLLTLEIFDCWDIDFMGSFPFTNRCLFMLEVVNYASKWVDATICRNNDQQIVTKFLKENICHDLGSQKP